MTMTPQDRIVRLIAIVASVVFLIISATAKVPTYHINPLFIIPLMWAPYLLRRRLRISTIALYPPRGSQMDSPSAQ